MLEKSCLQESYAFSLHCYYLSTRTRGPFCYFRYSTLLPVPQHQGAILVLQVQYTITCSPIPGGHSGTPGTVQFNLSTNTRGHFGTPGTVQSNLSTNTRGPFWYSRYNTILPVHQHQGAILVLQVQYNFTCPPTPGGHSGTPGASLAPGSQH